MSDPTIRFTVVCPKCGTERLSEYAVSDVLTALAVGKSHKFRLFAPCHNRMWFPSEAELKQIREVVRASLVSMTRTYDRAIPSTRKVKKVRE
jgi:hypothetical protein